MKVGLRERHTEGDKHSTRWYSKKQEDTVAKNIGGVKTISSGSTPFSKGDVKSSDNLLLVECKTKMKHSKSITIHKEWIEKNKREALFMGKDNSVIAFNFGPDEPNYYILEEPFFLDFLEYLRNK